jgi:hypothetical protein
LVVLWVVTLNLLHRKVCVIHNISHVSRASDIISDGRAWVLFFVMCPMWLWKFSTVFFSVDLLSEDSENYFAESYPDPTYRIRGS